MYGDLASWRAHAAARGDTAPTDASDSVAIEALTRASDHIKYAYVSRFVSPYTELSDGVEEATYEAANLELSTPGFFTKTFTPAQQKVLTQVDAIKWTVVGDSSGSAGRAATPVSTLVEAILTPYLPMDGVLAPYIKTIGAQS